jgi:hypothetical protein
MYRLIVLAGVFVLFALPAIGQDPDFEVVKEAGDAAVRKQIIVADLENQIKNIPYAAVRVCTRYRLAAWLWKDGEDKTGRAEEIAVAALEDHFRNKTEIAPTYSCHPQLFILLDKNAKEAANEARKRHDPSRADESLQLAALLNQADGERRAVDAALGLLSRPGEGNPDLVYLMFQLESRGSPELNRLLAGIVASEESGATRYPPYMIEIFGSYFIKPAVPVEIKRSFIRLVVRRSLNVAQLTVPDQDLYFRLLRSLMPEIPSIYPEILGEASIALGILGTRMARSTKEAHERYERINNSADPLAATVAEAERATEDSDKNGLYTYAARLALRAGRFTYAVDLMEKASEFDKTGDEAYKEFQISLRDQFYRDVIAAALKANQPVAANYAIRRVTGAPEKAEAFRNIAAYFVENGDVNSGREAHDEAIKILSRIDGSPGTIATLLKMIPVAQKIDPTRVFELNRLVTRSINNIPNLNVEDRPDTANYREYVRRILLINSSLFPVLSGLVKENRNAAEDLASRIDKKEVRIMADFVLLTNEPVLPPETE